MGLTRLHLVNPRCSLDAEAIARASGADDLLAAAPVHQTLPEALAGCRLVVGTSARLRHLDWPQLDPRACGERLVAEAALGEVALILGRESSGLSNDELARCQYLAHIPTAPGFSSLNLAAAAQVFAYEVFSALGAGSRQPVEAAETEPAPADALEGLHVHLAEALTGSWASRTPSSRTGSCIGCAGCSIAPDRMRVEVNILRGILSAAQGRKRRGATVSDAPDGATLGTLSPPESGSGQQ